MRTPKRQSGARDYKTKYTRDDLNRAVQLCQTKQMTLLAASKKYKIPFGTLHNKVNHKHTRSVGAPRRLSTDVEKRLLLTIDTLSEWKFPLDGNDICYIVKDYLDRAGITDARFKKNLPGRDWLTGFVKRNKLTKRLADNVKPARAEVNRASVIEYFTELEKTVQNVPPTHLYNFDETNVTDDPGSKTVICRRGLKRVERKIQHSKTTISIMYCGNAAGNFLPPMVVYRAQNCYVEWTTGGPKDSAYDATKSGWFDSRCFEKWFSDVFLTAVRDQQGTKVVIADNLASHFSPSVIQASLDNDIRFVCLIPNSTHLLQPLDVGVFRPLKLEWRNILQDWRRESRVKGSIPKNQFPGLLKKLHDRLKPANLTSGFAASGIYPLDREAVLKRLPDSNRDVGTGQVVSELFNDAIATILSKHCGDDAKKVLKRGKKIVPGRGVMPTDVNNNDANDQPSTSGVKTTVVRAKGNKKVQQPDSDTDAGSVEQDSDVDSDEQELSDIGENSGAQASDNVKVGEWVVVSYPGKKKNMVLNYVGQILEVSKSDSQLKVKFVRKQPGGTVFKFPDIDDIDIIPDTSVIERISQPQMNNREQLTFTKIRSLVLG